jgi:hypothetical protein
MSVHFAAARGVRPSPLARMLSAPRAEWAANDNVPSDGDGESDGLRAALEHFAEHGLDSVRAASRAVEAAHRAGNHAEADRWLGICRAFDRRTASRLARRYTEPAER